jgi:NADH-quinone oxidoreductase subunit J
MPIGGLIAGGLAIEMVVVSYTVASRGAARLSETPMAQGAGAAADVTNAQAIGQVLYTNYVYFFQAAGLVLLVAMIGAIVLTLRHKPGVRRQVIMDQVLRTPATGMRMVSPKPGEGIVE